MGETALSVLVVDGDQRVADRHAKIVTTVPGFAVAGAVNSWAAAHAAARGCCLDLALIDTRLGDRSGLDLVRELPCDTMVLTSATDAQTIRSALSAGALSYLIKPFAHAALVSRLAGYMRYRRIMNLPNLLPADLNAALDVLRPRPAPPAGVCAPPTEQLILKTLRASGEPLSSSDVANALGISRATAHRYLKDLVDSGTATMRLRYGPSGRPTHEFCATP